MTKKKPAKRSKPNGQMPEVSPVNAVLLPTGHVAASVIARAQELNDAAITAHEHYQELSKATSDARREWKDLLSQLQDHLRIHTHPSTLPILGMVEAAEKDTEPF